MICARDCGFSYGERRVFSELSLELHAGELLALIGPNGAGKTTLIHVLSGVKRPTTGSVLLKDDAGLCELSKLSPEARARRLAVVEQSVTPAFDFTVLELVAMGRYPHRHTDVGACYFRRTKIASTAGLAFRRAAGIASLQPISRGSTCHFSGH